MQLERIAVMGAGATGTIMGALIARSGLDTTLVSSNSEHVRQLGAEGASITGGMTLNVPVKAALPDRMEGSYDFVIYSAKTTADHVALKNNI